MSKCRKQKKSKKKPLGVLTMFIDEQGQVLSVVRVDVEQQSRTMAVAGVQGDLFSIQHHNRVDIQKQRHCCSSSVHWAP